MMPKGEIRIEPVPINGARVRLAMCGGFSLLRVVASRQASDAAR